MIYCGDSLEVLKTLEANSAHTCVTSPPYWGLRDYGVDGQLGLEKTPDEYVSKMVEIFREVRRVLRDDGTLWLNLGDSYANVSGGHTSQKTMGNPGLIRKRDTLRNLKNTGLKMKDLVGIPWRVAFALQADGWYLRQDIIWHKPNPMPESVRDRCTKAHEYIFLLSKSPKYYFDHEAIKEPSVYSGRQNSQRGFSGKRSFELIQQPFRHVTETRNKRSVWTVTTKPFKGAHFATFPQDLIGPCVLAGSPKGGTVLDPFFGAGTTGVVARKHDRDFIGIELNPEYVEIAKRRING
jgi:DNA modification methylase